VMKKMEAAGEEKPETAAAPAAPATSPLAAQITIDDFAKVDLRVATVVDGLAAPGDATLLLAAVTGELERRGADLLISNQMHPAWDQGLRSAGFLAGPSNFIFSASQALASRLAPRDATAGRGHVNRGDGDGPIHL